MALTVFFPQQALGHCLAFEFLMNLSPVRYNETCGACGDRLWVELDRELGIVKIGGQWPGEIELTGLFEQLLNRTGTGFGAGADLSNRQA